MFIEASGLGPAGVWEAWDVIPTVILVGLVFGRWWRIAIPVAVLGWPILLITTGVDSGLRFAVAAGLLAAANVLVGVLAYQGARLIIRASLKRYT